MIVADLGGDDIQHEVTVDGDNWMAALRAGRAQVGEQGGVPPGSSCAVAADGKVTILDPISRRRFVLSADTSQSYRPPPPGGLKVPSDTVPRAAAVPSSPAPSSSTPASVAPASSAPSSPASPPSAAPQPGKKRAPSRTVAYMSAPNLADIERARAEASAKSTPSNGAGGAEAEPSVVVAAHAEPSVVVAAHPEPSVVVAAHAEPSVVIEPEPSVVVTPHAEPTVIVAEPEPSVVVAEHAEPSVIVEAQPTPARVEPMAATPESPALRDEASTGAGGTDIATGTSWSLLAGRDEDPSESSPLTYRERSFVVPAGTPSEVGERIARERMDALRASIEGAPRGQFLNVAVFDHRWTERPERPPVATAVLKDWQGDLVVERPLERFSSAPPPAAVPSEAPRKRTTDEHDTRLAEAFEACQDLLFLSTPVEALEFVVNLMKDVIPAEAATASLYDIDADVLRVVTVDAPDAPARRGDAVAAGQGLIGSASRIVGSLVIDDMTLDGRYDAAIDGSSTQSQSALYLPVAHQGRFLAVLQLVGRVGRPTFGADDADLGVYIAKQLGTFLYEARIKTAR